MHRFVVFVLLLQVISYWATSQPTGVKLPDLVEEQTIQALYKKNKVKTISIYHYTTSGDARANHQGQLQENSTLNSEGFMTKRALLRPEGEYVMAYRYNDRGYPVAFTMDHKGKRIITYRYYYHEDGTTQSIVFIDSQNKLDSSLRQTTVEWLEGKKKTTYVTPAVPGTILIELVATNIEEYNRLTRQYVLTQLSDGKIYQRVVYDLDGKGAILRKSYEQPTSDSIRQYIHRYNPHHLRVESVTQFQNPKKKNTERMEYNKKGLPVTKTTFNDRQEVVEVLRYAYTYF